MKRFSEILIGVGMFGFPVAVRFTDSGASQGWVLSLLLCMIVFGIIARIALWKKESKEPADAPAARPATPISHASVPLPAPPSTPPPLQQLTSLTPSFCSA